MASLKIAFIVRVNGRGRGGRRGGRRGGGEEYEEEEEERRKSRKRREDYIITSLQSHDCWSHNKISMIFFSKMRLYFH